MQAPAFNLLTTRESSDQLEWLNWLLKETWGKNPFYTEKWRRAGLRPRRLSSLHDLKHFPLTTRSELLIDQAANPLLGTNLIYPLPSYTRVHRSSGTSGQPIYWADTLQSWRWVMECSQKLARLSGIGPEDRVFFNLSFGPSSGPWIIYEGFHGLNCMCCTAGAVSANDKLTWLLKIRPSVIVSKLPQSIELGETLRDSGVEPAKLGVCKIINAGAPGSSIPEWRQQAEQLWGASCFDRYGMTEAGSIAAECPAHAGGMHLLDDEFIAEAVQPATCEPVDDGQPGELVLTNLGRPGQPIIRYRTGDITRLKIQHRCACGRSGLFLTGGILVPLVPSVPLPPFGAAEIGV